MDNDITVSGPETLKTALRRDRSAAYPAITIQEALKWVNEIYKNFRQP